LLGFQRALNNLDQVIALIRAAKNPKDAREALMAFITPAEAKEYAKLVDADPRETTRGTMKKESAAAPAAAPPPPPPPPPPGAPSAPQAAPQAPAPVAAAASVLVDSKLPAIKACFAKANVTSAVTLTVNISGGAATVAFGAPVPAVAESCVKSVIGTLHFSGTEKVTRSITP